MTTYPEDWVRLDRDTPVPAPTPEQCEAEVIGPPEPGTGTLWVSQSYPGVWHALWLSDAGFTGCEGTEETVVAWAREQPAPRVNVIPEVDSGIARAEEEWVPGPPPEPGTGEVWVMGFRGVWHAGWSSDTGIAVFESEDRETTLDWAQRTSAPRIMVSENGLPHQPLNNGSGPPMNGPS